MCGIGGVITNSPFQPEEAAQAHRLMESLERRGRDAWGYFNGYRVWKEPGAFSDSDKAPMLPCNLVSGNVKLFLCHTRLSTRGDPEHNQNNHPFWLGPFVMAHNGVFYSFEDMPISLIQTDSYRLLHWINEAYKTTGDTINAIQEGLQHVNGVYAVWLHNRLEGYTYLFRDGNAQMGTCVTFNDQKIIFGSDLQAVCDALGIKFREWLLTKQPPIYQSLGHRIYRIIGTKIEKVAKCEESKKDFTPRERLDWWRRFGALNRYHLQHVEDL